MAAGKVLLHVDANFQSPYAMSSFVALREKNIDFEVVTIDLDRKVQNEKAFAETSLTQRVPTLVHDDFALSESSAIDEYVDDVFPGPSIYPAGARERARARQVQAWVRSDLMPIRVERSTDVIFRNGAVQPLSEDAKAAAQRLYFVAQALLPGNAENLFGGWSIADTDLALMLNRLVMGGDAVPAPLAAYVKRQWARPSIQAWIALGKKSRGA